MEVQELVGRTIGKFRIVKPIPNCGLGPSFEGVHVSLGKPCLIRLLPEAMKRDRVAVEIFRTLASSTAQVSHPALPVVQEVVYEPPLIGVVLSPCAGVSLAKRVASQGRLPFPEFAKIFSPVVQALMTLHKNGIAHRGVRPDSILIGPGGEVVLIDAGVQWDVRNAKGDSSMSVARFVSPEEAIRGPVDVQSDFYGLGATMYYALTGRPPFLENDPVALVQAHTHQSPMPPSQFRPDLPASYTSLVLKLLQRHPEQRGDDLTFSMTILDPHWSPAPPPKAVAKRPAAPAKKLIDAPDPPPPPPKKTALIVFAGVLAALVAIGLVVALPGKPARPPSPAPAPVASPAKTEIPAVTATDETYYVEYFEKAKSLKTEGKFKEALDQADQASRFRQTPELQALVSEIKQQIILNERTERVRPQYEKILALAAKKEDLVALCFECEDFLRTNSDLPTAAEVKTIYDMAKKDLEEKQAKGPITKLPPSTVKPRPGQPRPPNPRPGQPPAPQPPPPPPPVNLGPEFDKAKGLVADKKYDQAKPILLDMLKKETNANNRRGIGVELYKCFMGDASRWKSQFDGRDLEGPFNVVRLSDSDISVAKDAPEITGWARENDIAMLQLKNFKGGTGISVECMIESKFQDPHSVALRIDFQAGNAYKDFYLSEKKGALKRVYKKEESDLATVPAQGIFKRWIRLTVVVEGDTLYGFANDFLVCALPTSEVKLGEDVRILIAGCSARLRDIQARF
jgi:serine/threonine-protein kinase